MADSRIPVLLELKRHLEEELESLRQRVRQIEGFIAALDSAITAGSFATADSAIGRATPSQEEAPTPELRSVELYDKSRELMLATLEITVDEIRVLPPEHASYDIKKGAFARFFVERILGKFQEEDRNKVEQGELTWENAFDFSVVAPDGILEEIVIKNYGSESRLNEIERALRWSLEKIYRAK